MKKELTKQKNYFQSSDISLCATLCCYGYQIKSINKENTNRAIFLIERDKKLDDLAGKYWTHQLRVEPVSFFNFLKEIKTRIYNKE